MTCHIPTRLLVSRVFRITDLAALADLIGPEAKARPES